MNLKSENISLKTILNSGAMQINQNVRVINSIDVTGKINTDVSGGVIINNTVEINIHVILGKM